MDPNQLQLPAEERRLGKAGIDLASFQASVGRSLKLWVRNRSAELEERPEGRAGGCAKDHRWIGRISFI